MPCTFETPCNNFIKLDMVASLRCQYQRINKIYYRCFSGHSFWVTHEWPRVPERAINELFVQPERRKNGFQPRLCAGCKKMIENPGASIQQYHTECRVLERQADDRGRSALRKLTNA